LGRGKMEATGAREEKVGGANVEDSDEESMAGTFKTKIISN
jgi:hypothetical protein